MGAKGAKDESEPTARLAAILGSTEDAVIGKTLYGTITSWDAGASAIYGYAPEEIIGRSMSELIPPDRPGELIAILERVARGERVDPFETRRVRKDGTLIDVSVSVSPILDETGTVVGATSVARDISARLRAAADRMAIERRLAAIVESSQDAIVGKTLDGTITTWNSGASAMYGYAPEEMIGRNISELIPPDRRGELITILDRLGRGQRVDPFETRRVRKDGTLIDVSVSVSPILDETGTLAGAASVARDISARLRAAAEQQVLEARLRQSERMETLGQLAGGIAHDFNNLLGIIVGCAGLLADDAAGNVELLTDVRRIEDAAQRAAALTRQLLIFGQRDLTQPEDVQLNDVITAVRELLSASLGGGVDLRFDPGARLPAITIDRGHVEQVLLNLVFNARDAMPGGGTVAVATRVAELDQRYCVKHPDAIPGRYVELTISDTGTGMSPEVAARIFEPFYTSKPIGRGAGLGLSTIYSIVTRAGGNLSVQSEPGAGTVFRVYLPASEAPAQEAAARPGPAGGQRILVVDDEPAVLAVASRILRKNGYAVLEAGDGEEAMSVASSHDFDFDLLLTDSVLPRMSGQGLAERFSARKPGLRVLRMSGASAGQPDPAFLEKPFTAQTLLARVRDALSAPSGG